MEGEFLGKARERGPVRVGEFVVESGVATEEAKDEDSQAGQEKKKFHERYNGIILFI